MNWKTHSLLCKTLGKPAADALYFRFVQDFATQVARLDLEDFDTLAGQSMNGNNIDYGQVLELSLSLYEEETGDIFPQDPMDQLRQSLRSMASAWNSASARILRAARGAPVDTGLGLIVQEVVLGIGRGESGSGVAQFTSPITGDKMAFGRYLSQSQGRAAINQNNGAKYLAKDLRGPSCKRFVHLLLLIWKYMPRK